MPLHGLVQALLFLGIVLVLARPLGIYMARVFQGRSTYLSPVLVPMERAILRMSGIRTDSQQTWQSYGIAMLVFQGIGCTFLYLLCRLQHVLPLNPDGMSAVDPWTAFNLAVSFVTNTNWQTHGGETTLSPFTQMVGLTVQNFFSAGTGLAVFSAVARGFAPLASRTLGNFWVDLVRAILHVLLPLSLLLAFLLLGQGVVQTIEPAHSVVTLGGENQRIPLGPVASQVAIKQLGTNGGGYYNANSAHPLENPTPLSNLLQLVAILLLPAALCVTFGRMVRDERQGWMILVVMTTVLAVATAAVWDSEQRGNPVHLRAGLATQRVEAGKDQPLYSQAGGNMEGKEVRFGIAGSVVWATATTAASNGSVNSMHDSYTPLGGMVVLWLIQLGEVIFGGVGSGLYGMLMFILVAVFLAGLMVGRAPEFLGKKIGPFEMKMAALAILLPPLVILVFSAVAVLHPLGLSARSNPGPHGLSQILYWLSSTTGNNGSAFAGYGSDNILCNSLGAIAMLVGRYWVMLPVLAIAGSLSRQSAVPATAGTLPTHTPLFAVFLLMTIIAVGALNFLPVLALGPMVEHLMMIQGGS